MPVNGALDDFECFERFKPIDVGLVRYYSRLVLSIGVSRNIIILRANNLPVEKVLLAPPSDFRQVKRCLCRLELRLRLRQLLIDFGSVNLGKNIARLDLCPNVEIPVFQVPARLSVNRRVSISFRLSGQHWKRNRSFLRMDHGYLCGGLQTLPECFCCRGSHLNSNDGKHN